MTNWDIADDSLSVTIGISDGGFFGNTFPRTGVYKVTGHANIQVLNATAVEIMGTTDNSSYDALAFLQVSSDDSGAYVRGTTSGECILNISDTANRKIKIELSSVSDTSSIQASTNRSLETYVVVPVFESIFPIFD